MIEEKIKKNYSVKEVSNKFNISEHTVRYYTDIGLIPTLKRDKNNKRIFDEDSLNWLSLILCFRNCGMSIESIKEYERLCSLGDSTIEDRYNIILDQQKLAEETYENAKKTLDTINNKVKYYQKILDGTEIDHSNPYNFLKD